MRIVRLDLNDSKYPEPLSHINSPPEPLYYSGAPLNELVRRPRVAIVGTRKMTIYGKRVTLKLATDLAEQGIVIVSGLAFGIDVLAHASALEVGGTCIAVLPGPLDNILPTSNRRVAQKILENGGTLVSEYSAGEQIFRNNFVARNRIVSGLAEVILIIEAGEKSGALHTATFAKTQNRDVLVVPGNIDSPASTGTNNLLKSGAGVVTSYQDVLFALGIINHHTPVKQVRGRNAEEQKVLDLILGGVNEGEQLQQQSSLDIAQFNQVLTMLEVSGKIRPLGANQWAIT